MSSSTKTATLKQQARRLIDGLPDNCTVEDIQYQLYLMDKINRGEESLQRHGGIPHEDIKKRFAPWPTK